MSTASFKKLMSIFLVMFISSTASLVYAENIITNSNFKIGLPVYWERDAWQFSEQLFAWSQKRRLVSIDIPADKPNDARWIQVVNVRQHTDYVLSGWIKTKNIIHTGAGGAGANLSILDRLPDTGHFTYSDILTGNNGWTYRQVQFNSGVHTHLRVALRVGMFGGTTSGIAWFRDIRLEEAD